MKKIVWLVLCVSALMLCDAQTTTVSKKYPSLFWEITGNGLSRPSYLFGTMHVSSKMVFHLPDSFYLGIKNCDVVALETNPESWQEDLVKYEVDAPSYSRLHNPWTNFRQMPNDYLNIRSLQFDKYEKQVEAALYSRPSTINNLLYRNYSDYSSDFEENTYLDMYIYQVGKKMGKRVAGVEKYDESMKLMMEAYHDAAREKNHKQKSFDSDDTYSADKLQEAYRSGNLDLLDSINRVNSFSDAFDEKFLYSRNLLQANSIDSILKTQSSLFVGVGAAHLPGNRGVIEILRRRGYKLRPIMMGEKDSNKKEMVEKLRVPVNFITQTSDDGFFKCDIPGKFYRFNEEGLLDQLQYADMANGSYYMVTRIKTSCTMWGQTQDIVEKKIDSLLYENVPGKILSRQEIVRNGYKGLDVLNRTRRGDVQRYNIFITPYEVIVFKMSGNGDYVKEGEESKKFFGSIRLKEYDSESAMTWKKYRPAYGGFSVDLPHDPFVWKNKNWQYEADDKKTASSYTILRTDIHNYNFVEEDAFDLELLEESFSNCEFIDKLLSRKFITWNGYPALDCKYLDKDGSVISARFLIQGPHYYTLIARAKKDNDNMRQFLNSFTIEPFVYKQPFQKKDTSLCYRVTTTFYPEDKKIKLTIPGAENSLASTDDSDDDEDASNMRTGVNYKNNIIENDTTGEKIYVSCYKTGPYYYNRDSSTLNENRITRNGSWIIRSRKKYYLPGNWRVLEFQLSDTSSSRLVWTKSFYRSGVTFSLATEGDTLTPASSFVKTFFESFTPDTALGGYNPFVKKSGLFFTDYFSSDTFLHRRAIRSIEEVTFDSTDFAQVKKAIAFLNWSDRKYIQTKKSLIGKLGEIKTKSSSDLLKQLYYDASDTVELQYGILETLLQQQTAYAFNTFKDIITEQPPVVEFSSDNTNAEFNLSRLPFSITPKTWSKNGADNGQFWDELYDSIRLTRSILPGILPLLNLDDYKWRTMRLLGRMIDSNLVQREDYQIYFSKFLMEAKQELRKEAITEKKKLIKKAAEKDSNDGDDDDESDVGNEKLALYAKLILPFWETAGVPDLFHQLLRSADKKVKYSTMLLMIKNNKPLPDSLLSYFAAMDDYRYDLYNDLQEIQKDRLFPMKYDNKIDLAKSKLFASRSYDKPDSVLYLDKLPAEVKSKQGYIYFFKYKDKKDDRTWKLASAGLVSKDPKQFDFSNDLISIDASEDENDPFDFTLFTDSKVNPGVPVREQLSSALKKLLHSHRKSAKEFYEVSKNDIDEIVKVKN